MALSESFNKMILKLGENLNKIPGKEDYEEKITRPDSPFLMLLSEGDEEFNFDPTAASPYEVEMRMMENYDDQFGVYSTDSRSRQSSSGISADENEMLNFESSEEVCNVYNGDKVNQENDLGLVVNETMSMPESDAGSIEEDEISMRLNDEQRSYRNNPMTHEEFSKLFDPSGRLVNEHELRRAIFKGGVMEDIRKEVWQFLFELYPINSTTREREILRVEQTVRYEAMKIRWKKLLKTLVNEYEGVRYCPKWYSGCPKGTRKRENNSPSDCNISDIPSEPFTPICERKINDENITHSNGYCDNVDVTSREKLSDLLFANAANVTLSDTKGSVNDSNLTLDKKIENHDHAMEDNVSTHILGENGICNGCESSAVSECDINTNYNKQKLECDEVDNITEILAEAMLDFVSHDERISEETDNQTACSSTHEKQDGFQILSSPLSPPRVIYDVIHHNTEDELDRLGCVYSDDMLHTENLEDENARFPNPFTLSPEFVNNQESLYSKSENFMSCDILEYDQSAPIQAYPSNHVNKSNSYCKIVNGHENEGGRINSSISLSRNDILDTSKSCFDYTHKSDNVDNDLDRNILDNVSTPTNLLEVSRDATKCRKTKCDNPNKVRANDSENTIHINNANTCTHNKNINKLFFNDEYDTLGNFKDNMTVDNVNKDVFVDSSLNENDCTQFDIHNDVCNEKHSKDDRRELDVYAATSQNSDRNNQEKSVSDIHDFQCKCSSENHSVDPQSILYSNFEGKVKHSPSNSHTLDSNFQSLVEDDEDDGKINDKPIATLNTCHIIDRDKVDGVVENKLDAFSIKNENLDKICPINDDVIVHNAADTGLGNIGATIQNSTTIPQTINNQRGLDLVDDSSANIDDLAYSITFNDGEKYSSEHQKSYTDINNMKKDVIANSIDTSKLNAFSSNILSSNYYCCTSDSPENNSLREETMNSMSHNSTTTESTFNDSSSSIKKSLYCNNDKEFSSESSDSSEAPVSLTPEHLGKLPTWILQVINASTPPTKRSRRLSKKGECKYLKENEFLRAMDDDISNRKELMDIVENANKYLKEKANLECHSIQKSSDSLPLDTADVSLDNAVEIQSSPVCVQEVAELPPSPFMSPISSTEVDLLVNDRLQFQLVTDHVNDFSEKDDRSSSSCPYCNFNPEDSPKIVLPTSLGEDQLKFMQIQAQVFAAREPYDSKTVSESIRVIDKDVPRTDRELPMFRGDDNIGLVRLRDALLTYAFFHPDVGYAQGMNDIMSRFLVVMDTESEAYWMFVHYMEHFKSDFMEEGMLQKIALVEQLLMKMDRELFDYLQSTDMGLMFCHRWLLLNFKREFDYKEALRLFEITSSRHLEVSSLEAELERAKERAKEFVKDSAGSHLEEIFISPEFPFDIFICVAMLMECRDVILDTSDLTAVYQILSNLPTTLDLQNVIRKAEELFYQYCRKSVVDCFQVIDELEVQDFKRKNQNSFSFALR